MNKGKSLQINGNRYDCVACDTLVMHVPARESHLKPGARLKSMPDDKTSTATEVAWLVLSLKSGDVVYVTTAWAEFLFRKAGFHGHDFHANGRPLGFSYDRNCVDFHLIGKRAYEYAEGRRLHGSDTQNDFSNHYRCPYMIFLGSTTARGVSGVEILKNPGDFNGIARLFDKESSILGKRGKDVISIGSSLKPMSVSLERGDVLAASRAGGVYEHYAVYVGNGRVIHYAGYNGDFGETNIIHEAPIENFTRGATEIQVLSFPNEPGKPENHNINIANLFSEPWFCDLAREKNYHLYGPDETVARARSRLGENKYFLPSNNCEHFALWCKTGVSESHQVNKWLSLILSWATSKIPVI